MEEIKVATLENEIEARLLDSILVERNIPHFVMSYYRIAPYSAYDIHLYQLGEGWGGVYSTPEHVTKIKEILADIRREKK